MYVDSADINKNILYQGDVITNFPFHIFKNSQSVKKNDAGYFEIDPDGDSEHTLHIVQASKSRVIILSQSCDIQRRKNIIICPVYNLVDFTTENTINADSLRNIRERKLYYLFYLPAFLDFPESIADLQTMLYVPKSVIEQFAGKKTISLDDLGRHHLAWSLATFFGRPADA